MRSYIKKLSLFFLFSSNYHVHSANFTSQVSTEVQEDKVCLSILQRKQLVYGYCKNYHLPAELSSVIQCFTYSYHLQYKNKPLPNDLSQQDLAYFDFTGCSFINTNVTDTILDNAILTNTVCDYQSGFQNNVKEHGIYSKWHQSKLPKDLKAIADVYPNLTNHTHKSKLLHIACGLSRLPLYQGKEFWIKLAYWSCVLLKLKGQLNKVDSGYQLTCSMYKGLCDDANQSCWKTIWDENRAHSYDQVADNNFEQYLKNLENGITKYVSESYQAYNNPGGVLYYKKQITKNIQGLGKIYPKLEDRKLQEEASSIGYALSKSYQIQELDFLFHYLFYQNRLAKLKRRVPNDIKDDIFYCYNHILVGWASLLTS